MTPEQLVQYLQDRERSIPNWRERPTRRETLEALLECHARAVAERDAERAQAEVDYIVGDWRRESPHPTIQPIPSAARR